MELNAITNEYYKDDAAQMLVELLKKEEFDLQEGIIYYNFPMFKEIDEDIIYPNLCVVSRKHGVILIITDNSCDREVNEEYITMMDDKLSQIYSLLSGKFMKSKELRENKKSLKFEISTVIFSPNYSGKIDFELENAYVSSLDSIKKIFDDIKLKDMIDENIVKMITSIVEGSNGIVKPADRKLENNNIMTKGKALVDLEKEINNLDKQQKFAALTQINGPQRIRGLAGSGKTVILCMKAVNILMKNPDAKILYTFYTKSLYDHIKLLISRFYRVYFDKDPNFENSIHVRHAWGGKNYPGVYYDACRNNRITPLALSQALGVNKFDYVCNDLLERTKGNLLKEYDYVLIDEAQDFSPSFYWICRKIAKNDNLVWAYDQLQNILNVEIQDTKTLFENKYGDKGIDLEKLLDKHPELNNDIVLPVCYRNPRAVLVLAHAIGFGIYNENIVQMLENAEHWNDNGYEVIQGSCTEGEDTIITRPEKNSPLSISEKYSINEIIECYKADKFSTELEWIAESISYNISDELLPQDIMIICIDQKNMWNYYNRLSSSLQKYKIYLNNTLDSYNNEFFRAGCVTFTSVYKAKGNESALVYVVGCDVFKSQKESINMRNKLFTAFTRSKAWLKVTGIGEDFECLEKEIISATNKLTNLEFVYPNNDEVKQHQRDHSKLNSDREALANLIQEFAKQRGLNAEDAIKLFNEGISEEDNTKK
ncbi:ATP-binding domain-containing protein [Clostridium sp.]|uniref:DEAD/DEAH box helicase n=1 Tax=Clostridium sp. TaxID=1506 RepID=UPI0026311AD4|nr:ATP-binding domain-containing protein [Clostridium sp.]